GMEAAEARDLGLSIEDVDNKGKVIPVAKYVSAADKRWLQRHRVELNEIPTGDFIEWLDRKLTKAEAPGKVMPPADVAEQRLTEKTKEALADRLIDEAKAAYGFDAKLEQGMGELRPEIEKLLDVDEQGKVWLENLIEADWEKHREHPWWHEV